MGEAPSTLAGRFGTGDQRPDAEKSPEELRLELVELRGLWRIDEAEIRKVGQRGQIGRRCCCCRFKKCAGNVADSSTRVFT